MLEYFSKWFNRSFVIKNKLPKYVLVISRYSEIKANLIKSLKLKYKIEDVKILGDKDDEYTIKNRINMTKGGKYPDLIILCSDVLMFYLQDPLILYKAEIWHERRDFCESTFVYALRHYDECEIRNGR
ncbi:hypothetical protein EDEG_03678, partial [Edhazardia aedis USNM 41457]